MSEAKIRARGVTKNCPPKTSELFSSLLSSIQLLNIIVLAASYKRTVAKIQDTGEIVVKLEVNQKCEKSDPKPISDTIIEFDPQYNLTVLINETSVMRMNIVYGIQFKIENSEKYEIAINDVDTKKIFIEKQLSRLIWGFLREEIFSSMNKCGIKGVTLPLLI